MRPAFALLWSVLLLASCRGDAAPPSGDEGGAGGAGGAGHFGCTRDASGHAACKAERGESFYCGKDHSCVEAIPCEGERCCVPGDSGDAYCGAAVGTCSACVDEQCSTPLCPSPGCTPDNVDHSDCTDKYGEDHYCAPDGTCEKGGPCEEEDCCMPGEDGDAYCRETFGACDHCAPNWHCRKGACGGP